MQKNPIGCRHVLVKLPNGDLFDGGVGVHEFYIYNKGNFELSIMEKYDLETLDKHSWGIFRARFSQCPDFTLNETSSLIAKSLDDIYTNKF